MAFQTEAEYFASRAKTCRQAQAAARDPATAYAHGELARRYDEWARQAAVATPAMPDAPQPLAR